MRKRALLLCWILFGALSCAERGAPAGVYRLASVEPSGCRRPLQLFNAAPPAPFQQLASLSATCPYISAATCDRRLLARACELAADGVVVRGSRVIGRKGKPELVEDAVAIRFSVKNQVP